MDFDDNLQVVEMLIVNPPYILDFAKAYIDEQPDFSAETWREHWESVQELFEERTPVVRKLLSALQQGYGINYLDAKPGNINFTGYRD